MQKTIFAILGLAIALPLSRAVDLPSNQIGKVIAVTGKATAMLPNGTTREIKDGDELAEGTVLKTSDRCTVDLFFRRIGTIVQLQESTVLSLDKLETSSNEGKLVRRTELSLKEGAMLAYIRVLVPESKVIVRTPKTLFHVPGTGLGRYEFRANGSALVGRKSKLALVVDGPEPVAIMPGQFFDPGSTNAAQANPARLESFSRKMDALQNIAAKLTPPPSSEERR